jgi:hypothetical protein
MRCGEHSASDRLPRLPHPRWTASAAGLPSPRDSPAPEADGRTESGAARASPTTPLRLIGIAVGPRLRRGGSGASRVLVP